MASIISVCLPVFNGEQYLAEAIESVLEQTFSNFELLISDDRSTDSSFEIIEKYARQDRRIKHWRNESNLGLFANYNECMRRAGSALIKLFAQDDLLLPRILEKQAAILLTNPDVRLVSAARNWIDDTGLEIENPVGNLDITKGARTTPIISGLETARACLFPIVNKIGEPTTVMFRRSSIGSGFDCNFHQIGDLEYWLRILGDGSYYQLDEVLCSFRCHESSTSSRNIKGLLYMADFVRLQRKYENLIEQLGKTQEEFSLLIVHNMAQHLDQLVQTDELSLQVIRSLNEPIRSARGERTQASSSSPANSDDLANFREILFHSLLELARKLKEVPQCSPTIDPNMQRQLRAITVLERQLRELLSSLSWRSTRWLREIKRLTARGSQTDNDSDLENDVPNYDELEAAAQRDMYIAWLKKTIDRVYSSRSWKVTEQLRRVFPQQARTPVFELSYSATPKASDPSPPPSRQQPLPWPPQQEASQVEELPAVETGAPALPSRAEFAATWDNLAGQDDLTKATVAVIGTDDPNFIKKNTEAARDVLMECLAIGPDDTVLEIGCGVGRIGEVIAPLCKRWIGTDVSQNMLKHAHDRIGHLPNVETLLVSGYDLEQIPSNSIDVVYCTVVFMHLSEWDRYRYIQEGLRVLKPGGRMLVDNINLLSENGWKVFLLHTQIPPLERPPQIAQTSTPQELEIYFKKAGFEDIQQKFGNPLVSTFGRKPRRLHHEKKRIVSRARTT